MKKALFFDIDGTLVNFQGQMPDSAKRALQQVQKNGHLIAICSGRSVCQIYPWLLEIGFDGIIAAAGAYVEYNHQVVYEHHMGKETLAAACGLLEEAHAIYSAQTRHADFMTADCKKRMEERFRAMWLSKGIEEQADTSRQVDERLEERPDIEKLVFFDAQIPLAEIQKRLAESCDVTAMSFDVPAEGNGEISSKGINKALGIQKFIEYAGIARQDTIAFGDGPNDFDMLAYAHVGVAMGNAMEDIRKQADYVTAGIDEDGIERALRELGLL